VRNEEISALEQSVSKFFLLHSAFKRAASRRQGANQLLEMNHEAGHGVAEENNPRRKPWEPGKKAISPGRGDKNPAFQPGFLSPLGIGDKQIHG
jgi:hypothetical protein